MSRAALFHPEAACVLPDYVIPPAPVADIVEEVRIAWYRVAERNANLHALCEERDRGPAVDRENARRAAAADDPPPPSVVPLLTEMAAEAERAFGGALIVCVDKMVKQAAEMFSVQDQWLADLRSKHAARVPAIKDQIAMLVEEFTQLADDAALIAAVERLDGNPKSVEFAQPNERREARQRERVEKLVRESRASVERTPAHLLAALDQFAEEALAPPAPLLEERLPVEETAAREPGGGSAAW